MMRMPKRLQEELGPVGQSPPPRKRPCNFHVDKISTVAELPTPPASGSGTDGDVNMEDRESLPSSSDIDLAEIICYGTVSKPAVVNTTSQNAHSSFCPRKS